MVTTIHKYLKFKTERTLSLMEFLLSLFQDVEALNEFDTVDILTSDEMFESVIRLLFVKKDAALNTVSSIKNLDLEQIIQNYKVECVKDKAVLKHRYMLSLSLVIKTFDYKLVYNILKRLT